MLVLFAAGRVNNIRHEIQHLRPCKTGFVRDSSNDLTWRTRLRQKRSSQDHCRVSANNEIDWAMRGFRRGKNIGR